MNWYLLCVVLHVLAAILWFGHMVFWTLVVGPMTKCFDPPEAGRWLRVASMKYGGLGWPALVILGCTGVVMLGYRGVSVQQVISGELLRYPFGRGLAIKFALVAWMVLYQSLVGHTPAPRLIYVNIFAALSIVGLSLLLVRAPSLFDLPWIALQSAGISSQ